MKNNKGVVNNTSNHSKDDYYTTKGRKIGDFCIGFFSVWIFLAFYIRNNRYWVSVLKRN